jgi:DUF438 domain-containing protein
MLEFLLNMTYLNLQQLTFKRLLEIKTNYFGLDPILLKNLLQLGLHLIRKKKITLTHMKSSGIGTATKVLWVNH